MNKKEFILNFFEKYTDDWNKLLNEEKKRYEKLFVDYDFMEDEIASSKLNIISFEKVDYYINKYNFYYFWIEFSKIINEHDVVSIFNEKNIKDYANIFFSKLNLMFKKLNFDYEYLVESENILAFYPEINFLANPDEMIRDINIKKYKIDFFILELLDEETFDLKMIEYKYCFDFYKYHWIHQLKPNEEVVKKVISIYYEYINYNNRDFLGETDYSFLFYTCRSIVNLLILNKMDEQLFDFISKNSRYIYFDNTLEKILLEKIDSEEDAQLLLNQLEMKKHTLNLFYKKIHYYYSKIFLLLRENNNNPIIKKILEKYNELNFHKQKHLIIEAFNNIYSDFFVKGLGMDEFDVINWFKKEFYKEIDEFFSFESTESDTNNIKEKTQKPTIRVSNEKRDEFEKTRNEIVYDLKSFECLYDNYRFSVEDMKIGFESNEKIKNIIEIKHWFSIDDFFSSIDENHSEISSTKFELEAYVEDLENQMNKLNIKNAKEIMTKILSYEDVKKTLLVGVGLWEELKKNNQRFYNGENYDLTPYIVNYLKGLEIFLALKLKEKINKLNKNGIKTKDIFSPSGKKINIETDKITLGEMYNFIKREPKIVKEGFNNNYLSIKIENWTHEIRNSHFHDDLVISEEEVRYIIEETLKLFNDIELYI